MNIKYIKRIIKEEIDGIMNGSLKDRVSNDISYLKSFNLIKHLNNGSKESWKFSSKNKDYMSVFYILKNEKNLWFAKLSIYWKEKTNNFTSGAGKDMEKEFGPYRSYEDLVKNVNLKLENNPLISNQIYKDDWNHNMDEIIKKLALDLKYKYKEIEALNDNHFNDLKEFYHKIKNMNDSKFFEFCEREYPEDTDKQSLILRLQKIEKLPFYNSMKKMH